MMKLSYKIFLIILPVFLLSCSENIDNYYFDIHDSKLIEGVNRGWIPSILPRSATEIHERHNIDTNSVWIKFKFNISDIKIMTDQLTLVSDEIGKVEISNPGVEWWPEYIDIKSLASNSSPELSLYKYDRTITYPDGKKSPIEGFFLIDWKLSTAYYWQSVMKGGLPE